MQNVIITAFSFPKKSFNNIYMSSSEMNMHNQNEYSLGAKKEIQSLWRNKRVQKTVCPLRHNVHTEKCISS